VFCKIERNSITQIDYSIQGVVLLRLLCV